MKYYHHPRNKRTGYLEHYYALENESDVYRAIIKSESTKTQQSCWFSSQESSLNKVVRDNSREITKEEYEKIAFLVML